MKIKLDNELFKIVPELKLGINHYTKITVSESPQMLKGRLQLFQEQLFFELEKKPLTDFPNIKAWRAIWKAFGADPNRYRPSAEALFRRIQKQNYLHSYHSAVDLNTFFSLQYEIPSGIYDLDKIVGNVHLSVGGEKDGYDGLNGRFNSLTNILLLRDDYSPFGSPTVDSVRTAVTEETTSALHVLFMNPSMSEEEALKLVSACGSMFTSISGGDSSSFVLSAERPSIVLD
ncbi:phenylalanine--tRNA ligase beta subunit-related protein [Sporosarcina thermotolerans]|uniref:Phenylalanine--tRNA ligase beta subunit-related protein n=1 Tax=Sporosarcina thermotolerans TaxID=633404 RepID=A0AAW9ACX1_9BACL|nr:phenylalanine--tRNA ligase beta subunit-related protein [Sporosarcina thermotolerans]MDW0118884.1 phenylalanine--tRNA ligase beta subunit-related protein [Sporosarcina thermotolerans]WHT49382.1 phenylalanine--tRNA ligase beta subunit-related protein [Sporosarcina thermotolerans]